MDSIEKLDLQVIAAVTALNVVAAHKFSKIGSTVKVHKTSYDFLQFSN